MHNQAVTFRLWAVAFLLTGSLASTLAEHVTDPVPNLILIGAAAMSLIGASLMLWMSAKMDL